MTEHPNDRDMANKYQREAAYWQEKYWQTLTDRHPAPDPAFHGSDAHKLWAYWREQDGHQRSVREDKRPA